MRSIATILTLSLLLLGLTSCSGKRINIDERTQNNPNDVVEDNNNGTNPKLFKNEQYQRTPRESDVGHCLVTFHMTESQLSGDHQLADGEISLQCTYEQCLDRASDKLYSSNNNFAKVHFDRSDGSAVDTVLNKP
jgi:hypothetical protein